MNVGHIIMDIVQYGDIHEAPWLEEWFKDGLINGMNFNEIMDKDQELYTRLSIAATIHKMMYATPGGYCFSKQKDSEIKPILNIETNFSV